MNTTTLAEITENLEAQYMQYPIYLIKEKETSEIVFYKYTNFKNHFVGQVQVNLDSYEVIEITFHNEPVKGEIFQQVAQLLKSNIKKHLLFLIDSQSSDSITYLVMDHHHEVLGTIDIEGNQIKNQIQINDIDIVEDFILEQAQILRQMDFPASYFTRMDIEFFSNSLYILQTSIYKETVNYLYLTEYDNRIFGHFSINKSNGSIQLLSESWNEEEGVHQVVADRLKSCYLEEIYHDCIELEEMKEIIEISNEDLNNLNIPKPFDVWDAIHDFCLSFDAYSHWDTFDEVAKIANDVEMNFDIHKNFNQNSLTDLRTNLFLIQRACNHRGEAPDGELLDYIHKIIEAIRMRVTN